MMIKKKEICVIRNKCMDAQVKSQHTRTTHFRHTHTHTYLHIHAS